MGLMDILNGMQNGPHGQPSPSAPGSSSGMSPITMALLGLLAYKAIKGGGLGNVISGGTQPPAVPSSSGGGLGGVLGGLLGGLGLGSNGSGGLLGGLLGGGAAGGLLNGGLKNLLTDLEQHGQGSVAQSWVSSGENQKVAPEDLAKSLGTDTIDALSQQTGMPRDELLATLSQHLPELVNQMTPNGRLPTDHEASHW